MLSFFFFFLFFFRIAREIHPASNAQDIAVFVEIERDRSLFSYRRHVATFSSALDCNVHAHSIGKCISGIKASRRESVHFLAFFDFTLFPLVFLLSVLFFLSLFLSFCPQHTFFHCDRLKFR